MPEFLRSNPMVQEHQKQKLTYVYREQIFNAAAPFYTDILDKCGYSEKLTFDKEQYTHERKNRGKNIIWYNPPLSKNVKTNIEKQFLHLLDKHFDRNHKYHKIFNYNNVKISYSCMDNMANK